MWDWRLWTIKWPEVHRCQLERDCATQTHQRCLFLLIECKRILNYYFLSLKIPFVYNYHRRKHTSVKESDELQNALNDFCQEEEKNRKEKEKKQRNNTIQSAAAVAAPNGVGLMGKMKRTTVARNNKKKGSISVFPGGYHISKILIFVIVLIQE